jgi:hypothetical protein
MTELRAKARPIRSNVPIFTVNVKVLLPVANGCRKTKPFQKIKN